MHELGKLQIKATLTYMVQAGIRIKAPIVWNADGRAHPNGPVTVSDISESPEFVTLAIVHEGHRVTIEFQPDHPSGAVFTSAFTGIGNMTDMTVLRALTHAVSFS